MRQIISVSCAMLIPGVLLSAADDAHLDPYGQKVRIIKIEHMDFPAGGTLHLKNSTGTLTVEGWERPEIEITTVRSSRSDYSGAERDKWTHYLDRVQVSTQRNGNELVITTTFPNHNFPIPGFLRGENAFDLDYRIKVPRDTHLIDEHYLGNVNVENVTGDIDATLREGEMLLRLPEQATYAIHAKSDLGSVHSDYPVAQKHRPWPFGDRAVAEASGPSHKLNLKVGYGDILILKTRVPQEPPALTPSSDE